MHEYSDNCVDISGTPCVTPRRCRAPMGTHQQQAPMKNTAIQYTTQCYLGWFPNRTRRKMKIGGPRYTFWQSFHACYLGRTIWLLLSHTSETNCTWQAEIIPRVKVPPKKRSMKWSKHLCRTHTTAYDHRSIYSTNWGGRKSGQRFCISHYVMLKFWKSPHSHGKNQTTTWVMDDSTARIPKYTFNNVIL